MLGADFTVVQSDPLDLGTRPKPGRQFLAVRMGRESAQGLDAGAHGHFFAVEPNRCTGFTSLLNAATGGAHALVADKELGVAIIRQAAFDQVFDAAPARDHA